MRSVLLGGILLVVVNGSARAAEQKVNIRVTGAPLVVNGQATVPVGLFGVHHVKLTPGVVEELGIEAYRGINFVPSGGSKIIDRKTKRVNPVYADLDLFIDCQGDRFYEPLPLRNKNFREQCASIGKAYGELWKTTLSKASKQRGAVQLWNEPYLNWAERSAGERGSTINQQWYDVDKAEEGGPVTIKGWDEPLRHFRWRSLWPTRQEEGKDRKGNPSRRRVIGWNVPIPEGLKEGDTFEAAETRYWRQPGVAKTWALERHWYPVDPTQVGFWSGRQNLDFYLMMFRPWAEALRGANPDVTILAGWDWNYSAGGWSSWTELYRPILKQSPELVDGVTEHHYGIPPVHVQAWYELGTSDAWAITGRWLKNWNTECQGRMDPAVYGRTSNASGGTDAEQGLWEANYNLADIIGLATRMPGKVGSRTAHNFIGYGSFPKCGAAWALRLLKPMRGRLMHVSTSDQRCFAVASQPEKNTTVLALYNRRAEPMRLAVSAGAATSVESSRLAVADGGNSLGIAREKLAVKNGAWEAELPSRHAVVFRITGRSADRPVVSRSQFFAEEGGLHRYEGDPTKPVVLTITTPEAELAVAGSARLRLVTGGGQTGAMEINGHGIDFATDLPVTDVDIPLTMLRADRNTFHVAGEKAYLLVCASVILENEARK